MVPNALIQHGRLRVAASGTHLEHADGTPFFWLACTAWNGALRASDEAWARYLEDRAKKGFTVIQMMGTPWRGARADREGRTAYAGKKNIAFQEGFFRGLDRKIEAVNRHGLVAAIAPAWSVLDWTGRNPGRSLSEKDLSALLGAFTERYAAFHVVWILGGDCRFGARMANRWRRLGRRHFPDACGNPVAIHGRAMEWTGDAFRDEEWISIVGYQSGHGDNRRRRRWVCSGPPSMAAFQSPARPVIDLEPSYEGLTPLARWPRRPIDAREVRCALYHSLLAVPVAGVTYGAHALWNFGEQRESPVGHPGIGVAEAWHTALDLPGGLAASHLSDVMSTLPWWTLRPCPQMLRRQPGERDIRRWVSAVRSLDGKWVVVYTPTSQRIDLAEDQEFPLEAAMWFDPRSGQWTPAGGGGAGSEGGYDPPGVGDWVFLLRNGDNQDSFTAPFKVEERAVGQRRFDSDCG